MEFKQKFEPSVEKPIMIAAMQDMGNVGSIVINFINQSLEQNHLELQIVLIPHMW